MDRSSEILDKEFETLKYIKRKAWACGHTLFFALENTYTCTSDFFLRLNPFKGL